MNVEARAYERAYNILGWTNNRRWQNEQPNYVREQLENMAKEQRQVAVRVFEEYLEEHTHTSKSGSEWVEWFRKRMKEL